MAENEIQEPDARKNEHVLQSTESNEAQNPSNEKPTNKDIELLQLRAQSGKLHEDVRILSAPIELADHIFYLLAAQKAGVGPSLQALEIVRARLLDNAYLPLIRNLASEIKELKEKSNYTQGGE